jgi:hypothetical protein
MWYAFRKLSNRSLLELRSLEVGEKFFWHWLPATGRSGGMLMGFRDSRFEIGNIDMGQYFLSVTALWRATNLKLEIMGIYGPADHSLSREFLDEITLKINRTVDLIIMGGDFNLIRSEEDKNNHRINWARLNMFNEAISDWAVREIPRTGARFTWTNKQLNHVRSVLDRVFIAPILEPRFPLCSVVAETSLGSDHTPLILDTGEDIPIRSNRFFFETGWFEIADFHHLVSQVWDRLGSQIGGRDITDWWQGMSGGLRQYLRGWSKNIGKEQRVIKSQLLDQIKLLDEEADADGLEEQGWVLRYHLKEQLINIYKLEEEYWRQRGRVRWSLQGDGNTAYFHAVANGCRRKCLISSLNMEAGPIMDKRLIQEHIYSFYRDLLGSDNPHLCGLAQHAWELSPRVSPEENLHLALTFSEEELTAMVKEMKTDTAPGSDGFPVAFFSALLALSKTWGFTHPQRFYPGEDRHRPSKLWCAIAYSKSAGC